MSELKPNPMPLSTPFPPSPRRAPLGSVAKPLPIIIDCDPGHDDAMALAVALARPELKVLGVTAVAGNASLEKTYENLRRVLALLGASSMRVAAGAAVPLVRPLWVAPYVHGDSGLDGADLPAPVGIEHAAGAVDLIATLLRESAEPVTLVPLGPLTNIAILLRDHPELKSKIAHICWMGGAIGEGNVTASAEFNSYVDPDAAAIVFAAGIPITMVCLDATHRALTGEAALKRLESAGTLPATIFADLLRFYAIFHKDRYDWPASAVHDAVAVAHLAVPNLLALVHAAVDVELGDLARGRTITDWYGDRLVQRGRTADVDVAVGVDADRFDTVLVEAILSFK